MAAISMQRAGYVTRWLGAHDRDLAGLERLAQRINWPNAWAATTPPSIGTNETKRVLWSKAG